MVSFMEYFFVAIGLMSEEIFLKTLFFPKSKQLKVFFSKTKNIVFVKMHMVFENVTNGISTNMCNPNFNPTKLLNETSTFCNILFH